MSEKRPIIVIKKKVSHGGHHGGAWKVAYADFVTAMMALFIVLWLMNSSAKIQKAVGGYFKDPTGTAKLVGTNQDGSGENFAITKDNMQVLKEELQKAVRQNNDLEKLKDQIEMTVTAEGLRIELLETEKGTFFDSGSSKPSPKGSELLTLLAHELSTLPNKISIEGHTDSRPFTAGKSYGNWELSSDRGNATRRLMQQSGVGADQVSQVRGYADQRLRKPKQPEDASNRRISLIVQYLEKHSDEAEPPKTEGGDAAKNESAHEGAAKQPEHPPEKKEAAPAPKH
jgi:chemotaxis protein MotB